MPPTTTPWRTEPYRHQRPPRRWPLIALGVVIVLLAVAGYAGYTAFRNHATQALIVPGCQAGSGQDAVPLDFGQVSDAATIAGVAVRDGLPREALTIAYATAIQESKLENLDYGTSDSVGIFQQRPSQGWGTPKELIDPVYAAGAFFAALVKVPDYMSIPIYQAAQDVQHSADGQAYMNYQQQAAWMSGPFTGGTPHAVWCWYPRDSTKSIKVRPMRAELTRTFGPLDVRQNAGSPSVRIRHSAAGWAVASWLVTHATTYGLTSVRFAGYQWSVSAGNKGWTRDPSAPRGSVELR